MIENDKQLSVSQYWIEIFKKAIEDKEKMRSFWSEDVHVKLHEAELDGMKAKLKELEQEVVDYAGVPEGTCPYCGSKNVILFSADDDLCNDCGKNFQGE